MGNCIGECLQVATAPFEQRPHPAYEDGAEAEDVEFDNLLAEAAREDDLESAQPQQSAFVPQSKVIDAEEIQAITQKKLQAIVQEQKMRDEELDRKLREEEMKVAQEEEEEYAKHPIPEATASESVVNATPQQAATDGWDDWEDGDDWPEGNPAPVGDADLMDGDVESGSKGEKAD
eukprot:Clim_evm35s47 gene=Clim_evmTU35s47